MWVQFIGLAAEQNDYARYVTSKNFPEVIHTVDVGKVRAAWFQPLLQKRDIKAIIVGGGSPCQGNSSLNRRRRHLLDPRSRQPEFLAKLAKDLKELPEVVNGMIPVLVWLEMVGSARAATLNHYANILEANMININARSVA